MMFSSDTYRKIFFVAALTFFGIQTQAMPPGLKIDVNDGSFEAGGINFEINHYDKGWTVTRQSGNSVVPISGYPVSSEKVYELKGTLQFGKYPSGLTFQEWIKESGDDTFTYSMAFRGEQAIPTNILCLAASLPIKDFSGKNIIIDDKEVLLPQSIGEKGGLEAPVQAKSLILSSSHGKITITGDFVVATVDKRNFKVDSFDIRIYMKPDKGDITQAKLGLTFKIEPLDSSALSFKGNISGAPASAILSEAGLRAGDKSVGALKFVVPDPAKNGLISLAPSKNFTLKTGDKNKGNTLALLTNATGDISGAKINVRFKDGSVQTISPVWGVDIGAEKSPLRLKNAVVAGLKTTENGFSGIYMTQFNLDKAEPASIEFVNSSSSEWRIAAVSLGSAPLLMSQVDSAACIMPGGEWILMEDSGAVKAGTVLDLSASLEAPAGRFGRIIVNKDGHFTAEKDPAKRFRFLGQNLCFTAQYLEKAEAEKLADEFAALGYNSIRLHHFDGLIVKKDSAISTELDPENLDKIEYLFHCLKKRGIYMTIDMYCSRNLKDGELPVSGTGAKRALKAFAPVNEQAQTNWKTYAKNLLTHKNPYTGMTWAEDPALFGVSLLNENTIYGFWDNKDAKPYYEAAYAKWLKERSLDSKENLEARGALYVQFMTETQIAMIKDFSKFLREETGYKGLVTDANFRESMPQALIRNELDFVDNHTYWDHPGFLPNKSWWFPMVFQQQSALNAAVIVPKMLFPTRVFGKPFTVTEINYTFPNKYRSEGGPLIGAYASLQDWDAVYRFAWAHDRQSILREKPINGFDTVRDPVNTIADKIVHFMFVRGDVDAAKTAIALPFSQKTYEKNVASNLLHFPAGFELAGLSYRVGVAPADSKIPGVNVVPDGKAWQSLLPESAKTLMDNAGIYAGENGEIIYDQKKKLFSVVSPRTESFVLSSGTVSGKVLKVADADSFQTVTASSIDGNKSLAMSSKILVFHQTDATNLGIRFSSEALSTVEAWGYRPTLLRKGTASVSLVLNGKGAWKVTALSLDGTEKGTVASSFSGGVLSFKADTSLFGGTMIYLVSEVR